jgi:hypothetical protein
MHTEPLVATTIGHQQERLTGARVDPAFSDTPLDVADTEVVGRMGNLGDAPGGLSWVGPLENHGGQPEDHNSAALWPTDSE